MQLYFLAPLFYRFIISKIKLKPFSLLCIIIGLGLAWRLFADYLKLDWYTRLYVNSFSNLDLFFAGFILNAITKESFNSEKKLHLKVFSFLCLFLFIGVNTFLIDMEQYEAYRYIFPTIYLVLILSIIYSTDFVDKVENDKLTWQNILNNPIRLIEGFGIISFEFYLFHSNILEIFTKIIHFKNSNLTFYFTLLVAFILTLIWSIIIYFSIEKPINNFKAKILKGS